MSKPINTKKITSIITGILVGGMFIATITTAAVLTNKPPQKRESKENDELKEKKWKNQN
ncbi:hypothetical protein OF377_00170 [Ureaplasma sp. ES3154-GEN]|uniref:hypothetical protein n=1 Tax=Ureaplasma sp. ES3154-GEN TaxID=2984844 RepID=UPI0021E8DF59|nr:hypothetical protein [Ureaplasma sp. ES3154-GEN]MCV3743303.1 hypothetical protein [Ureaplasma sp. ES3154-GEN]